MAEYNRVKISIAPFREAIKTAVDTLLSPDGISGRDYASWSGIPGTDRFCMVDFCGNATVITPQTVDEDANRKLRSAKVTYIPGWFLQSVIRTIVNIPPLAAFNRLLPLLTPLFDGHDSLGKACALETAWIDTPVDLEEMDPPKPFSVTITERPWCPHAVGFKPYAIHNVASSWTSALNATGEVAKIVWSRPRISLVALTGVDMSSKRLGSEAAEIYDSIFDTRLNARFNKEFETTISNQRAHLGFNRVRRADKVPQGWHNTGPDFGRAHPDDFLPPRMDGLARPDESKPFVLPAELIGGFEDQDEEVADVLVDTYEPDKLPEPQEDAEPDANAPAQTDGEAGDAVDGADTPPPADATNGPNAPIAAPVIEQAKPSASASNRLAILLGDQPERHLEFCLNFTTTTGELFGFYSKKGIEYAAGADMNGFLAFIHKLNPALAAVAETNAGSLLELDLANLMADVMILEPLLLDVSYADQSDGDCHYEVSVELLKSGGWFADNAMQAGQIDPAPKQTEESGTDVEYAEPAEGGTENRPRLTDLPDKQPYYRVRIRHTGKLDVGVRQPLSNLLAYDMLGFIELYVEPLENRDAFRSLPYKRWRATKPDKAHLKQLGLGDIHTHEHSPGIYADILGELVDTASLVGGFTPAVVIFDAIDVLHFATYLTTMSANLILNGEATGRTATGQRVEGVLQPAMMLLAAAPILSKGKVKAGFQLVGATGAFGMLGWTAWDAASNASVAKTTTGELAKRYGGYTRMNDNKVFAPQNGSSK